MSDRIRFAIVGTGRRSDTLYAPLPTSRQLQRYATLVLCGRKWGLICSRTHLAHFGKLPEYGPLQARLDQEVTLAMYKSAKNLGASVGLPT